MKDLVGAKFVPGVEEITPRIQACPLGVIEAVLGNILVGDVDEPARVEIRFGLKVIGHAVGGLRPVPSEFGGMNIFIDDFQGFGLGYPNAKEQE